MMCVRRGNARRTLAAGIAALLLAQIGLSLAVETVKPEWRDPEFGVRMHKLRQLRDAHPNQPLVLAVGSSRTQMGLVPSEMTFPGMADPPLVFNFGQAGAGPLLELLTLERILREGIKPDCLLVELFRPSLITGNADEREVPQVDTRLGIGDLSALAPYCRSASRLWRDWTIDRLTPWTTYRHHLMGHWLPDWQPYLRRMHQTWDQIDSHGAQPFPFEATADTFRPGWLQTYRGLYGSCVRHCRVNPFAERTLRDIVDLCRNRNIALAFFMMPEGPAFQNWYPSGVKPAIDAQLQAMTRELHTPLFDYTDGFAENEFADSHHMLRPGAVRFTRKFTEESLGPWIATGARTQ
jgi:hypothetical protein